MRPLFMGVWFLYQVICLLNVNIKQPDDWKNKDEKQLGVGSARLFQVVSHRQAKESIHYLQTIWNILKRLTERVKFSPTLQRRSLPTLQTRLPIEFSQSFYLTLRWSNHENFTAVEWLSSLESVNAAGNGVNLSFRTKHYCRGSFRKRRLLGNSANSLTLKDVLRAISRVFTNHRKAFHALSFPLVELLSLDQSKYNLSDRNTLLSRPLEKWCLLVRRG